jgi:hypothetical protein
LGYITNGSQGKYSPDNQMSLLLAVLQKIIANVNGVWVKQCRDSPQLAAVFPRVNFFYLASYPDLT